MVARRPRPSVPGATELVAHPQDGRVPPGLRLATGRGRWVLLASVLGSCLTGIDATVVNIALPAIGVDLDAGLAALQWTVTAYTLTLASLILLGGAFGDRYGRRRIFAVGIGAFAVASVLCAVAPTATFLIGARALQGVGGALLVPSSLAILQASFVEEDRARAVGAWAGLSGISTAVAPFLGGWLLAYGSWRWVFLINPPLALVVVAIVVRHVPETRAPLQVGRLDLFGALLAFAALGGVTYAAINAGTAAVGSVLVWGPALVALAAWGAFVRRERRVRNPLLPLGVFSSRQFSAANLVTFVVYACLSGYLFLLVIELQVVAGFSPLLAGAALLPLTALTLLLSEWSGNLARKIGPRLQMTLGPIVCAGGLLWSLRLGAGTRYVADVLPALSVFGLGLAVMVAPLTAAVLSAVPDAQAGIASGINNAVARTAGLLSVALLPAVVGLSGSAYQDPERFLNAFHLALWVCAIGLIGGGLIAAGSISNSTAVGRKALRHRSPQRSDICG